MKQLIFVFCSILITIESSKCPESRKPHSTSCTIFYNCVNLPGGGYVWVPSKCTEGLIFQPYLRICVLPGDSWECDTLSTESSIITNKYDVPELINPNETSYMGLTEDPWNLSEFVDSSYTTDNIPDYQETATPYPLIEIAETMEHKYNLNASEIIKDNDYLQTQSDNKKYYSMLNQLIHHLLLYKKITIPLEFLASSSLSTSPGLVTNLPLANYLVQNYIQQNNNLQNTIITDVKLQNTSENNVKDDIIEPVSNKNSKNSSVFDNMGDKNNIILITDHVGNRQYLTIERYKSLGYRLDSQYIQLIPCIKSTRMPNITDCTRYYICEPVIASVIEYSCPLFTAFNRFARTCDAESYNKCIENKNNANANSLGSIDNIFETNVSNENICMEHGKTKDPTSESRYYICHSSPDNSQIKSIRMTCPNGLIFCQVKKVCTTKRLCNKLI
ncbi:hypothetical protein E2986_10925 [Frieseomelitta varia]|uniref:Chitin-binding type-2 domain-containing protein n=1 Tax=Frieseomelitta varia TaxID=561572 RepID=A0A833SHC5_9HYME|nr:hypothetical protein E2986_10925 [Frieseomelitta varia]